MSQIQVPDKSIEVTHLCEGKWLPGTGESYTVQSPYTGATIGEGKSADPSMVDSAVAAAVKAQKLWADTPLKERTGILFNLREILLRDIDKFSKTVSIENGKTLGESKAGVLKGIEVLEYGISLQNLDSGARMEVSRGVFCEYRREPLGVIANITPFNFPAMVPMWTLPIAITLGNAYVLKPSEKTPLTSMMLGEAFKEAGLPDGVLTILNGGIETVNAIIDHKDIKAIGFVGSSKIAQLVYMRAASLGKRVLALGGAKNHIVLLPDADPEIAGRGISDSFTGCAGQRCMAASVLLAVGDVEKQIAAIKARAESLTLGEDMGALITKEQVEFLNKAITRAEEAGAKVLLDGRNATAPKGFEGGYWLGPTILDNVQPGSEASKTELFGPVISIVRVKSISEAMEIENANDYGNACSVFTTNGSLAEKVVAGASAGMVGVNIGVPVPREPFSFGGINHSKFGHGDITGTNSLNFWSDLKKVTTKWEMQKDSNWMS